MSKDVIKARDILAMSSDEVWSLPNVPMKLMFDNGDVEETTSRRTIYCWYMWEIHRQYPKTPLLPEHSMKMERLSGGTHLDILGKIYTSCFKTYKASGDSNFDPEVVWKLIYEIVNFMYNELIQKLDEYVETINALDFLEVLDHPRVKEANDTVKPTQSSIDLTYAEIIDVLRNDDALHNNALANLVRSKTVSEQQVLQCIGPRGYVTEIDSTIFKYPILRGFAFGLRSLYDHMLDSRSAAKALMFAKNPLQKTEYFNRKLQLVGQSVTTLVSGDCGSTHTLPWRVAASELKVLTGMHYLEGGEIKTILPNDQKLIDKEIQLRTPFGCTHPDRQTICETCYGEMAYSVPRGTSPGHLAAIAICEKISQLVLSVKHVDGSSKVEEIDLGEGFDRYLIPGTEENTLRISPELDGQKVKIIIDSKYAQNLPDIYRMNEDFENVDRALISEIENVTFQVGEDDGSNGLHEMKVPTSMGSRHSALTVKALHYILAYGLEVDRNNNYVVDLSKWDFNTPIFELPLKHLNMLDYQAQVEKMLLAPPQNKSTVKPLSSYMTTTDAIKALLTLINTKISVNMSHILTIAYATAARDPENGDYQLPRGGESFQFSTVIKLMAGRDLGAMMAFERQQTVFNVVEPYVIKDRPRHPAAELIKG